MKAASLFGEDGKMDLKIFFSLLAAAAYIVFLVFGNWYGRKYIGHRKNAFLSMRKTRIVIYGAPLILSILLMIEFHQQIAEYLMPLAYVWIILCGFHVGLLFFDAVESKKIKSMEQDKC